MLKKIISNGIFLIGWLPILLGQFPQVLTPQPAGFPTYGLPAPQVPQNPLQALHHQQRQRIQAQNQRLIQEAQQHSQRQRDQLAEVRREIAALERKPISYALPSRMHVPAAQLYRQALSELQAMLNGEAPISLKKAVFLVENAFFEGQLAYEDYDAHIQRLVHIASQQFERQRLDPADPLARKLVLQQLMCDTLSYRAAGKEADAIHIPFGYDFEDIFGREDWSKMFVSKLLATGEGQCHSLPLLYLILAEEMGVDAYLAFSPEHSYVRFQDERGNWYNLELTNRRLSSDAWILGSGFVRSEAIRSRIYLDTLGTRRVLAQCLVDLAQGYAYKSGPDAFMLDCAETTLAEHPQNIHAQMLRSDYYTLLFEHVANQLGRPPWEQLQNHPRAWELFQRRNAYYRLVDELGYQPIPEEAYQAWRKSVEAEKEKQARENPWRTLNLSDK